MAIIIIPTTHTSSVRSKRGLRRKKVLLLGRDPGLCKRDKDPKKEKDPWVISMTSEIAMGRSMPLSVVKLAYQCIQATSTDAKKNLHLQ